MGQHAIKQFNESMDPLRLPAADVAKNRQIIFQLQDFMQKEIPAHLRVEPVVHHHFANGVYAREMILPKGVLIVGKIHKHQHLCIVKGKCEVANDHQLELIDGYKIFTAPAGVKRVILAHEDTSWTTVHVTTETDLDAIEREVIAESYDEMPQLEVQP